MIHWTGRYHIGFQFDGLPIRADSKHLPVIGPPTLIPMGQHVCGHNGHLSFWMKIQYAIAQLTGTGHVLIANGRD